jgi:DNA phosphorothioation-dependent restriction protein DptG
VLKNEPQLLKYPHFTHIPELMRTCEQRDELQRRLRTAFEEWYGVKDTPGKDREAKAAEKRVHHIQRSLGDHVAKHGCNRD